MKHLLAISQKAATKVFMTISVSENTLEVKGRLMVLASAMIENPGAVSEKDFNALPGGAEIFQMISKAVVRSRRAREAAARRASRCQEASAEHSPVKEKRVHAEPRRNALSPLRNLNRLYDTKLRYRNKSMRKLSLPLARNRIISCRR